MNTKLCTFRYLSIIIDAMDAQKCNIPHLAERLKSWESAGSRRLDSQFVGTIVHGVGTHMYMFDEQLKKDGDLNDSILWATIVAELERRKLHNIPAPQVLYLQGDNAKDNKHKALFTFCELLVRLKIFEKVKFSFLPVGHTHEDIDACFGAGSHMLHRNCAFTVDEVASLWKKGWPSTKTFRYVKV